VAKATHLLRRAAELVRQRNYQDAVEAYLQATEADPQDSRAWFGLGVCLYRVGNLEVSRIALERAQRMGYPRAAEALERVDAAEKRRIAEGRGAKATVTPEEARKRSIESTAVVQPPPRPLTRPEQERIDLDRFLRVMVIENLPADLENITQAIEGTLKNVEVFAADYSVTTSDTMSSRVKCEVAVLDWDTAPDAATGLIQILKIKEPSLLVICLTEKWDPESAVQILEAGADYHVVKELHYASIIPLIIARWAQRDRAVAQQQRAREAEAQGRTWPEPVNALGEMLVHVAADYTIVQANEAAMRGFKKTESELINQSYSELLYGEQEPPDTCPILRTLQKAEPARGVVSCDSLGTAFSVRAWPVLSYAGKVSGAVALMHEGTDGAEVDEDLKDREWLFRNLTERSAAALAMLDGDGVVQYASPGLCALLGMDESELTGHALEGLVSADCRDAVRGCLDSAQSGGTASADARLMRAGAGVLACRVEASSLEEAGEAFFIVTLLPVADGERVELPAGGDAESFAALAATVPALLLTVEADGSISWCGGLVGPVTGREASDVVGTSLRELVAPDSRASLDELIAEAAREPGSVRTGELLVTRADGARFWAELRLIAAPGGRTHCAIQDISDRKAIEAIRAVLSGSRLV